MMNSNLDYNRQVAVVKGVITLISVVMVFFALYNYVNGSHFLTYLELLIALGNTILLITFNKWITPKNIKVFGIIFTNMMFMFLMYLFYIKDLADPTRVWVVATPLCAYMLTGHKTGFKITVLYLTFVVFISAVKYYSTPELMSILNVLSVGFLTAFVWLLSYYYESASSLHRQELINLAHRDKLTGLYNRHAFYNFFDQKKSLQMSLLIMDIDFFKNVNDTYGHDVGDYVLVEVAQTLESNIPKQAKVFRLGGEEFAVLMPDTIKSVAIQTAKCLLREVANRQIIYNDEKHDKQHTIPITISIGVSYLLPQDMELTAMMKYADNNLYKAKGQGRNCVVAD